MLTVRPRLPHRLLDAVLTSVERGLLDAGATRVWIDPDDADGLSVMAEVPELPELSPA